MHKLTREESLGLYERMMDGDQEALACFVKATAPVVLNLLGCKYAKTFNEHERQDILQEALVRFYRNLSSFDPTRNTPLQYWLVSIADHIAIDMIRGNVRSGISVVPMEFIEAQVLVNDTPQEPQGVEGNYKEELRRTMEVFIETLTELEQYVIREYLKNHGYVDYDTLAEQTEWKRASCRTALSRAKSKLAVLIEERTDCQRCEATLENNVLKVVGLCRVCYERLGHAKK